MRLIDDQRTDGIILQFVAPVEKAEFDQERYFEDFCADLMQQGGGGGGGPARGQKIINQQDAAARLDRVNMDGDGIGAVFKIITLFVSPVRELALFPDG